MRIAHAAMAIVAAAGFFGVAQAAPNLVTNGGFETTTNGLGQFDYRTTVAGWTSSGYNFVFDGNDAGGVVQGSYGGLSLYAPGNGHANGLGASPFGGNFVGADGAFQVGAIQQTLTGLTVGKRYAVNFYWGGAQQNGFTGSQTEQWEVSLGNGPSQFTSVYQNETAGFSGWIAEKFIFTADGTSQVLSFLAHGTPDGVPPFSLLDGVSASAVPEPATWGLMVAGLGAVGFAARRRRRGDVVAA